MGQVSTKDVVSGVSFDHYMQGTAQKSSVCELMGGPSLLKDHTSPGEMEQLQKLANEQLDIARHFNMKFSNMAFTLLQKMQQAFVGIGGIAKKFVDDMAAAGLNFTKDAMAYETELCSSDTVTFTVGLKNIWLHIADLIRKAETLELTYEGAQKNFNRILTQVGIKVKEYLDKQTTTDCTVFMNESFDSLCSFSDAFNMSPFIPVIVGTAITHHSLLTSLWVNVSHIPMQIYLLSLTSNTTVASGQIALLCYVAQQSLAI